MYLTPSADRSRCEVNAENKKNFLQNAVLKNLVVGLMCAICSISGYMIYWFLIAEHALHRAIRKRQWNAAETLLAEFRSKGDESKVCGSQVNVAALVNRLGRDRKFPIQLALEFGATRHYTLTDPFKSLKTDSAASLPEPRAHPVDLADEAEWRSLLMAMLDPTMLGEKIKRRQSEAPSLARPPSWVQGSHQEELPSTPTAKERTCRPCSLRVVLYVLECLVFTGPFLISVIYQ